MSRVGIVFCLVAIFLFSGVWLHTAKAETALSLSHVTASDKPEFRSSSITFNEACIDCQIASGRFFDTEVDLLLIEHNRIRRIKAAQLAAGGTVLPEGIAVPAFSTAHLSVADFDDDGLDELLTVDAEGKVHLLDYPGGTSQLQLALNTIGAFEHGVQALGAFSSGFSIPPQLHVVHKNIHFVLSVYSIKEGELTRMSTFSFPLEAPDEVFFMPTRARVQSSFVSLIRQGTLALRTWPLRCTPIGNAEVLYSWPDNAQPRPRALGDFNGDGFADLLVSELQGVRWYILSDSEWGAIPLGIRRLEPFRRYQSADLNGDGVDDLLAFNPENTLELRLNYSQVQHTKTRLTSLTEAQSHRLSEGLNCYTRAQLRQSIQELAVIEEDAEKVSYPATWWRNTAGRFVLFREFERAAQPGAPLAPGGALAVRLPGPYVCNGYNPGSFNAYGITRSCPESYAFVALEDGSADNPPTRNFGTCCPLPDPYMLSFANDSIIRARRCPEGSVAVAIEPDALPSDQDDVLVCQKLREGYQTGAAIPGVYWGQGTSRFSQAGSIPLETLPFALQTGIRRRNLTFLDSDGCIASRPGAFLTALGESHRCESYEYRSLYKDDREIPSYPHCDTLLSPAPEFARCK